MTDRELRGELQRMSATQVSRRGFLAGPALRGVSAFLAACSRARGGTRRRPRTAPSASATPVVRSAAASAPSPGGDGDRRQLLHVQLGRLRRPGQHRAVQEHFGVDEFTYDTFASNEEMIAKLQAGATGLYDVGAPTAELRPTMVDQGFIEKHRLVQDPQREVHRPAVQGPLVGPRQQVPPAQGLGHDRHRGANKFVKDDGQDLEEFFDVAPKYSGKIVVVNSPGDVMSAPLKALGYS